MSQHPLVARLAAAERLPRREILACRTRRDAVVPVFVDIIDRAAADPDRLTDAELDALFFVVHLLGEFAEPAAFPPLVAFLRGDQDLVETVLGDGVTATLNGVLISTFDEDTDLLEGLIEDANVDEYVRSAALEAWVYLVAAGRIDRSHADRYLAECAEFRLPRETDFIWTTWLRAVAHLGVAELKAEVKRAYEDGRVDDQIMNYRNFERLWAEVGESDDTLGPLASDHIRPFVDTLAEFERWHAFSEQYRREERRKELAERARDTRINVNRGVGRNDPCPCGSGRKFKKCCGG